MRKSAQTPGREQDAANQPDAGEACPEPAIALHLRLRGRIAPIVVACLMPGTETGAADGIEIHRCSAGFMVVSFGRVGIRPRTMARISSVDMSRAGEAKTTSRKIAMAALLGVVSVLALAEGAAALTAGQCEVFGERGLIDDATRQACCREHAIACPEGAQGGFGGGTSQSQGFGGGAAAGQSAGGDAAAGAGTSAASPTSQATSAVDAIRALGGGRGSGSQAGSPQGWGGERNANSRTPEQDYAVKTTPYFFEDKSKYPQ